MPHRRTRGEELPTGSGSTTAHKQARARVEHVFARMKTWKTSATAGFDVISLGVISRQSGVKTAALVERMAPEDLWNLVPAGGAAGTGSPAGRRASSAGRSRSAARDHLRGHLGCTWNQLPPGFDLSGVTAFRRLAEWTEARVWAKLHRLVLDGLGARGELDWSRYAVDSVSVRALEGGS